MLKRRSKHPTTEGIVAACPLGPPWAGILGGHSQWASVKDGEGGASSVAGCPVGQLGKLTQTTQ